ncbi:MAG TPA: hypothetical protein VF444_19975 [Pseudonocardiaceae bacterium]
MTVHRLGEVVGGIALPVGDVALQRVGHVGGGVAQILGDRVHFLAQLRDLFRIAGHLVQAPLQRLDVFDQPAKARGDQLAERIQDERHRVQHGTGDRHAQFHGGRGQLAAVLVSDVLDLADNTVVAVGDAQAGGRVRGVDLDEAHDAFSCTGIELKEVETVCSLSW